MLRSFSILLTMVVLVGIIGAVALRTSRANDGDNAISGRNQANQPKVADSDDSAVAGVQSQMKALADRIEILEKRLAKLEGRDSLVRQADSREPGLIDATSDPVQFEIVQPTPDQRVPQKRSEAEKTQQTNGQKWSFKLLGHR